MYTPGGSAIKALSTPKSRTFSFSQQNDDNAGDADKNSSQSEEKVYTHDCDFAELDEQLELASESNQKLLALIS